MTALCDEQVTAVRLCCVDILISNGQQSIQSRSQRPRSFWSATGIATYGQVQLRKSTIHGLPFTLRMLRVKSDKSDWFWSQFIVFTQPARGPDIFSAPQKEPPGDEEVAIDQK